MKETKQLINLAGALDWQFNHGTLDGAKERLTLIKRQVTIIDKIIKENTKEASSQ